MASVWQGLYKFVRRDFLCWRHGCFCSESCPCQSLHADAKINIVSCWQLQKIMQIKSYWTYLHEQKKIDWLNPDRNKQKNPIYESSSQIRKPGLRKPKQKNQSHESSSKIRKPGLRKPEQKNLSHESSSQIRKPRWINKTWQACWSHKTNAFLVFVFQPSATNKYLLVAIILHVLHMFRIWYI